MMHDAFDQSCDLLGWFQPKRLVARDAPKMEWSVTRGRGKGGARM